MPRYFFNLGNANHSKDDVGEVLATFEDAKVHARKVATELGAHQTDRHNQGLWIGVTDEQGNEVFRISLDGKITGSD
jgi:hypothetical protein